MKAKTTDQPDGQALRRLKHAGLVLLLILAAWSVLRGLRSDLPKPNTKPFASLGDLAAEETTALIGTAGSIAIVSEIPDPKSTREDPMVRSIQLVAAEVAAFKETLQQRGRFTMRGELKLVRPSQAIKTAWPTGAFLKLLQQHPPTTTIVAFCNLPGQFSPAERALLKSRPGKVIVVGGVIPDVKPLVDQGVAQLALAAKVPVPPPAGNEPETPREWVNRVYAVLKP